MKQISLTGKQIRKLRDRALREQRKKSAPPTRRIESKKVYFRQTKFVENWADEDTKNTRK